jgi:putative spermidine/putrescine transport system permease protein
LAVPGIVAGSIFTFSLTLGDYIVPGLVSTTQFIGNVIVINVAQDLPFAAAYSLVPLSIILVYLFIARRLGAFEAF